MILVSVYDKAVGVYSMPHFVKTKMEAIRSFGDACKDDKMPFKAHPEDYVLFAVGEFAEQTGAVTPYDVTEKLITALDCVRPE